MKSIQLCHSHFVGISRELKKNKWKKFRRIYFFYLNNNFGRKESEKISELKLKEIVSKFCYGQSFSEVKLL